MSKPVPTKSVGFLLWLAILQAFVGFMMGVIFLLQVLLGYLPSGYDPSEALFVGIVSFIVLGLWFWFCIHARIRLGKLREQAENAL